MKIVIAVLAVMPMFAHAADLTHRPLINRPQPNPPCGDFIDDCGRKPYEIASLGFLRSKTAGLSAAIADGKMDKAGEGLNGLFTGAGSKEKKSETAAVAAGAWTVEPRTDAVLSEFQSAPSGSRILPLIERLDGDRERAFKIVPVDLKEEVAKEIIKKTVEAAIPVVKDAVKKADQALSDRLTAPDTERARQEFGGCRMKGTCPK